MATPTQPATALSGTIADRVAALSEQLLKQNEQILQQQRELDEMRAARFQTENKITGGTPSPSQTERAAFLSSVRPECEFFNPYCVNYELQIFYDRLKSVDPIRRDHTTTPALWLKMDRWRGPGAEFPRDNFQKSDPGWRIGYWTAVSSSLVSITLEDIERYRLLPPSATEMERRSLCRSSEYSMSDTIAAIMGCDDFLSGQIISGEAFRAIVAAEYAKQEAIKRVDEETRARIENLNPRARLAGEPPTAE